VLPGSGSISSICVPFSAPSAPGVSTKQNIVVLLPRIFEALVPQLPQPQAMRLRVACGMITSSMKPLLGRHERVGEAVLVFLGRARSCPVADVLRGR
jgi:hypothetical protein